MDVSITDKHGIAVVTVSGRIDSSNFAEFNTPLEKLVQQGQMKIVLEMGGVDYMSSVGMRTIISTMKALKGQGGTLKLANLSNGVRGVLMMAGTELFDIHDSIEQAVASF
jgi:anti-anti-sigma factor